MVLLFSARFTEVSRLGLLLTLLNTLSRGLFCIVGEVVSLLACLFRKHPPKQISTPELKGALWEQTFADQLDLLDGIWVLCSLFSSRVCLAAAADSNGAAQQTRAAQELGLSGFFEAWNRNL